jgi:hypothetical protein
VTPELTNLTSGPAALKLGVELNLPPVSVSPQTLKVAAANLLGGASLLWVASNNFDPLVGLPFYQTVVSVLLFTLIAAALPIQLLLITGPLVRDVMSNSVAPWRWRLSAALAASTGSVLTALAYWKAWSAMSAIG